MGPETDGPERLYEVWLLDDGEPDRVIARFRRFDDAKQYCQQHATEGSFDVKMPSGRWYGSRRTAPVINPDDFSDKAPGLRSQGRSFMAWDDGAARRTVRLRFHVQVATTAVDSIEGAS